MKRKRILPSLRKRPLSKFDLEQIKKLPRARLVDETKLLKMAEEMSTIEEIAAEMKVSTAAIEPYMPMVVEAQKRGLRSLRARMFEVALGGNVNMLIWLSKQYLGFRDSFADEPAKSIINVHVNPTP